MKKEERKKNRRGVRKARKSDKVFLKKDSKKKLEKDLLEAVDGWKRARADYDNLKKRTAVEQIETIKRANENLVLDLLPVLDNFEHAFMGLSDEEKDNNWVKGFEFIKKQLVDLFEKYDVKEIKTVGEKFDIEKHEAVSEEKKKGSKKGEILKVVRKGYLMGDKVIRAAQVQVCA